MLNDVQMDLGMSSITSVDALSNFCKTPEYKNVKFIGKEDVKEYQEPKKKGIATKSLSTKQRYKKLPIN